MRRALLIIGVTLIAASVAVVAWTFWPEITYEVGRVLPVAADDGARSTADLALAGRRTGMTGDRVVIPALDVEAPLVEGRDDQALERGVWRHPESSTPGEPGRTVIAGHRTRTQFALLSRLDKGSRIVVIREGIAYEYAVTEFATVAAKGEIPLDASRQELVLYTCKPRWLGNTRTVVFAEPTAAPVVMRE